MTMRRQLVMLRMIDTEFPRKKVADLERRE